MASKVDSEQLSGRQIVVSASAVPVEEMKAIAEGFMDIASDIVDDLKQKTRGNNLEFNRCIIRQWLYGNPFNQKQVCKISLGPRKSIENYNFVRLY